MRIAFYAPLKPPGHPTPSGDRRLAGLFVEALRLAGHEPFVASHLRSYDGVGDPRFQAAIAREAERVAAGLLHRWRATPREMPELWFTYHLYHKAPDWLGPSVGAALGIPYIIAEASVAAKRAGGPWDIGHRAVVAALRRADAVLGVNPADREGVVPLLADPRRWTPLPPFLDARDYPPVRRSSMAPARLIAVAMMRPGDKLASYRLLGAALGRLRDIEWSLDVVGDGPARPEIAAALRPLGPRVRYRGALDQAEVAAALREADLFVWPAINEAFGMALVEAQASGLPVVAGASGGVGAIVADGETGLLVPTGDPAAFAAAARHLILDGRARAAMGRAARAKVRREHDLPAAAARLATLIGARAPVRAA